MSAIGRSLHSRTLVGQIKKKLNKVISVSLTQGQSLDSTDLACASRRSRLRLEVLDLFFFSGTRMLKRVVVLSLILGITHGSLFCPHTTEPSGKDNFSEFLGLVNSS